MISETFYFEEKYHNLRAIIIKVTYDKYSDIYELSLLGTGQDGVSFTNHGKGWFDKDDLQKLMDSKNLSNPQQLCGMQMMVVIDEKEFEKNGVPAPNISQQSEKNSFSLNEILSDGQELDLGDD